MRISIILCICVTGLRVYEKTPEAGSSVKTNPPSNPVNKPLVNAADPPGGGILAVRVRFSPAPMGEAERFMDAHRMPNLEEMDEQQALCFLAELFSHLSAEEEYQIRHEDHTLQMPQSGERIRGREVRSSTKYVVGLKVRGTAGVLVLFLLQSYCNPPLSGRLHLPNNPGRTILAGIFTDF